MGEGRGAGPREEPRGGEEKVRAAAGGRAGDRVGPGAGRRLRGQPADGVGGRDDAGRCGEWGGDRRASQSWGDAAAEERAAVVGAGEAEGDCVVGRGA